MNMNEILRAFVNQEHDVSKVLVESTWSLLLTERVTRGEAIADVEVVEVKAAQARLRCVENLSKFRIGDTLLLSRNNPDASTCYTCILIGDQDKELIITPGYAQTFKNLDLGPGWTLDRAVIDTRHILLSALDEFASSPGNIKKILLGQAQPQLDITQGQLAAEMARHLPLNSTQTNAFIRAFASRNFWLVQGPPGTGKTLVIAHLAAALASVGNRVLITAATHHAINNALSKIAQVTGCTSLAKIGDELRTDGLVWSGGIVPNYRRFANCPFARSNSGFIVGASCYATQTRQLRDVHFDVAIFDEAGQITIPLAVAGMLAADRYVFVGDHRQMPPIVIADHPNKWVTRSIFETLIAVSPGSCLDITYRMNEEINALPSNRFYEGELRCSKSAKSKRLTLTIPPKHCENILDPECPDIWVDIPHKNRRSRSIEEASLIAVLIREARRCGIPAEEIAVVTPFRAQARLIRQCLIDAGIVGADIENILCDTVERLQGQERDMVVVSLVTSDTTYASEHAEFYFQPNRLNVALTRARVKRIVVGSSTLLKTVATEKKHAPWIENFRELYRQSKIVNLSCRL